MLGCRFLTMVRNLRWSEKWNTSDLTVSFSQRNCLPSPDERIWSNISRSTRSESFGMKTHLTRVPTLVLLNLRRCIRRTLLHSGRQSAPLSCLLRFLSYSCWTKSTSCNRSSSLVWGLDATSRVILEKIHERVFLNVSFLLVKVEYGTLRLVHRSENQVQSSATRTIASTTTFLCSHNLCYRTFNGPYWL